MRLHAIAGASLAALMGLTLLAGAARAAPAYTNQGMNLRAGPGVDYPLLASLPPGTRAEVFGCLDGWSWCDVATGGLRGWMAGAGLQVVYDDQPEPLPGYGAEIGLPLVGFDFNNYWGSHYRGRSWYSSVDRWHGGGGPDRGRPGWDGPRGGFDGGPGGDGRGRGPDWDRGRGGDFRNNGPGGPGGRPDGDRYGGGGGGRQVEQGRGPAPGFNGGPGGNPGGRGEPNRAPQQAAPQRAPEQHGNPGGGGPGGRPGDGGNRQGGGAPEVPGH